MTRLASIHDSSLVDLTIVALALDLVIPEMVDFAPFTSQIYDYRWAQDILFFCVAHLLCSVCVIKYPFVSMLVYRCDISRQYDAPSQTMNYCCRAPIDLNQMAPRPDCSSVMRGQNCPAGDGGMYLVARHAPCLGLCDCLGTLTSRLNL